MQTIKKGSKGTAVKELQSLLGITADGIFGPQTEKSVKNFQNKKGLVVDGIVGPKTWTALKEKKGTNAGKTEGTYYIVKSGDSLWAIAQRFKTTVAAIQTANKISGSVIQPNQKILIPSLVKEIPVVQPKQVFKPLAGKRIVIDPGHGGHNENRSPVNSKYTEKEMVLKTALELEKILIGLGATVMLTRRTDVYIDLNERGRLVNDFKPDLCVSIHTNAGGGTGTEVIYSLRYPTKLAEILLNTLSTKFGLKKRKAFTKKGNSGDYYAMNRLIKCESIITELGFHDSKVDMAKIDYTINPAAPKMYAEAISEGLISYLS
jgi:N-acetylmuramoyl-L-alanine amidase